MHGSLILRSATARINRPGTVDLILQTHRAFVHHECRLALQRWLTTRCLRSSHSLFFDRIAELPELGGHVRLYPGPCAARLATIGDEAAQSDADRGANTEGRPVVSRRGAFGMSQ